MQNHERQTQKFPFAALGISSGTKTGMLSLLSGLLHAQDTVADFFIVKLHLAPEPPWPFPPVLTSGFPVRGEEASMAAIVNDLSEYLKTSP